MNRTLLMAALLIVPVMLITGCQSSGKQQAEPVLSEKDLLRTKWSCKIKRESDYQVQYKQNDFYATLTLPHAEMASPKRLRTDFVLPEQIEDIVSIKFSTINTATTINTVTSKGNSAANRLMKGYIPMHVCGDFFVRNQMLGDNALSVFTDISKHTNNGDLVWEIIYIDLAGVIHTTQKALRFAVQ
jgi:hypothetical protein